MTSIKGYKKDSPDKHKSKLVIPSNNITMKNVPHPVLGIDDTGYSTLMFPEENYQFPGNQVMEIPIRQMGGNTPANFISNLYNQISEESQQFEQSNAPNKFIPQGEFQSVFEDYQPKNNLMLNGINTSMLPKIPSVPKLSITPKPLELKPRTKQEVKKVKNENIMLPTIINGALGALNQAIQPREDIITKGIISRAQNTLNPKGYSKTGNPYLMQFGGTFLNNVGAEELAPQTELPMFEQPLPVSQPSNTPQNISLELGEDLQNLDISSKGTDVSTRNNNPGNIVFGKFAEKFGAVKGDKQKTVGDKKYTGSSSYAKFPTVGAGIEAMKSLLLTSKYQNLEVDEAMNLWIMGDKNEQGAYSKSAKSKFGSKKLKEVTENPQEFKELIKLMVKGESGAMYNVLNKKFKEGGEYTLSENEIQQILNNGGEIDYLD
jgi:hypothetical protein